MARRTVVLVMVLLLAPLATAGAQTAPAAPATPGAPSPSAVPGAVVVPPQPLPAPNTGNPSNPADFANNPHPSMPWFGPDTPYGQFVRWVWVPPSAVVVGGQAVGQPGYWVAETTAGYYYPDRWALAQGPAGELTWRMVPRAFQPR